MKEHEMYVNPASTYRAVCDVIFYFLRARNYSSVPIEFRYREHADNDIITITNNYSLVIGQKEPRKLTKRKLFRRKKPLHTAYKNIKAQDGDIILNNVPRKESIIEIMLPKYSQES